MVLMVAVIYKKRAIPLVWLVYSGVKGHTTGDRHIEVLKKLLPLIPIGASVILLGDAEYDTVEMLTWLKENTAWDYVIRSEPRILLSKERKAFSAQTSSHGQKQPHNRYRGSLHSQVFWPASGGCMVGRSIQKTDPPHFFT